MLCIEEGGVVYGDAGGVARLSEKDRWLVAWHYGKGSSGGSATRLFSC